MLKLHDIIKNQKTGLMSFVTLNSLARVDWNSVGPTTE